MELDFKRKHKLRRILFIAPVPPPINGQSKAAEILLEALEKIYDVDIVNLSKESLKSGYNSLRRTLSMFSIFFQVLIKRKPNDIVYHSIAESFVGNLRDMIIYTLNWKYLGKTYIHMLGGAGMKEILSNPGLQRRINIFFLKRVGGIIVEGPVNFEMFRKYLPEGKIYIVPNFAEDFLFVTDEEIKRKFAGLDVINVLYLSNLITGKGYLELADAYISLPVELKEKIKVTFVGGFESLNAQKQFLNEIQPFTNLEYLGKFIDGESKRKLYGQTHVFCLPTYYPFEGQPISILEAYASGCVVIASDHSGIPFIFEDSLNGFAVEKASVSSLKIVLEKLVMEVAHLDQIAFYNRDIALKKFRTKIFQNTILDILTGSYSEAY